MGPHVDAPGRLVQDQELGFGEQPAGEQHLLLVAPGEKLDGLLRSRGLDGQLLDEAGADLVLLLARQGMQPAPLGLQGQHHVLPHRGRGDDAGALAILRAETKAVSGRLACRADGHRFAPHPALAAVARHYAEHQLGGLGTTGPEQAGEAHYLPGHDVETEGGDDSPLAIVPERHHGLVAAQRLARPLEGIVVQLAPQHHLDQLQLWQCLGVAGADQLAVAQHCDAIADGVDLIEKMGDEDEAHPLIPQARHEGEEHLDFAGIQARGGLVQDQDPGGE